MPTARKPQLIFDDKIKFMQLIFAIFVTFLSYQLLRRLILLVIRISDFELLASLHIIIIFINLHCVHIYITKQII